MTDVLMNWPSPDQLERRRLRTGVLAWLALAVTTLVAATALVHGFDVLADRARVAQLVQDAGPVYSDGCVCAPGFSLPLPDWRSLGVWVLSLLTALVSRFIPRNRRANVAAKSVSGLL